MLSGIGPKKHLEANKVSLNTGNNSMVCKLLFSQRYNRDSVSWLSYILDQNRQCGFEILFKACYILA